MTHQYYIAKSRTISRGSKKSWEYRVRTKNKIKNDKLEGNYKKLEDIAEKVSFAIQGTQFISDPAVQKIAIDFYSIEQIARQYSPLSEKEFKLLASLLVKVPLDKQVKSIVKSY